MKKFTTPFKRPIKFSGHSKAQAAEWANATAETHPDWFDVIKLVVMDDGSVWIKYPLHYVDAERLGGKWEQYCKGVSTVAKERFIKGNGFTERRFRGEPRPALGLRNRKRAIEQKIARLQNEFRTLSI